MGTVPGVKIADVYLARADAVAPGLVQGLYLEGSTALGDYREGVSDVDFVAVTARQPETEVIRAVHAGLPRRPIFDGCYVTLDDLRRDPRSLPPGTAVHERRVNPSTPRSLVTWHVLAQGGVAVRGMDAPEVFTDWPGLAELTLENLESYWRPWARRMRVSPVGLSGWAVTWGVLGAARLRHTLAAGRVTSKTEAGRFAVDTYGPRWERIVAEALRLRLGGPARYREPFTRRADLLSFLTTVLDVS
jgi:hypothetical protein